MKWLNDAGHEAIHTRDLPAGNHTADADLCRLADTERRVVVTKDADFARSFRIAGSPARLLLISTGNIANNDLLALWQANLPAVLSALSKYRFVELGRSSLLSHE